MDPSWGTSTSPSWDPLRSTWKLTFSTFFLARGSELNMLKSFITEIPYKNLTSCLSKNIIHIDIIYYVYIYMYVFYLLLLYTVVQKLKKYMISLWRSWKKGNNKNAAKLYKRGGVGRLWSTVTLTINIWYWIPMNSISVYTLSQRNEQFHTDEGAIELEGSS